MIDDKLGIEFEGDEAVGDDRTVKSQSPTEGTKIALGSTVRVQLVPAPPFPPWVPIAAGGLIAAGLLGFLVRWRI